MTADVQGPAWALEGLGTRSGRYPPAVEGPVVRAVDRLVPGMSTVTRYIRYHSMYGWSAAARYRRPRSGTTEELELARAYRIQPPVTPASRFSGGDLSAVPGRVGAPTPLGAGPPVALRNTLGEVGLSYPELIERLFREAT